MSDAESYVSVSDCAAYAMSRGLLFPDSPADPADAALRRATAYIDTYSLRFSGSKTYARDQALQWPRAYATDASGNDLASDEVPVEVINATCEAAVRELASPGSLQLDLERGGAVKRLKAGSVEVEYSGNAPGGTTYTAIDTALANVLVTGGRYSARAIRI